jgi:hypothetical protein
MDTKSEKTDKHVQPHDVKHEIVTPWASVTELGRDPDPPGYEITVLA